MSIERFIASVYTFENKQGGRFIIIFLVSRAGGSHLQISIAFTQTARAPSRETSGQHGVNINFTREALSTERERGKKSVVTNFHAIPPLLIVNRNLKTNGWTIQNCRHSMVGGLILGSFGCSFPGIVQIATQNKINFRATSF